MFRKYIDSEIKRFLPLSDDAYIVSVEGEITDANRRIVKPHLDKEGRKVVTLNWIRGVGEYTVAELVTHTFKPLHLPLDLWGGIRLLFRDGDVNNFHPDNTVWKLPSKIPSRRFNGYYHIPTFTRYVINTDGHVYEELSGNEPTAHVTRNGYIRYPMKHDTGYWSSLSRHRAKALVFMDYPANIDDLHVNHLDGIPGSDDLDNLEITTPTGNLLHAFNNGLQKSNIEVIATNLDTDEVLEFLSISKCAEHFRVGENTVSKILRSGYDITVDGYLLKYKNPRHALEILRGRKVESILVRNVYTGEVTEYENKRKCNDALGLTPRGLNKRLRAKDQPIFHEGIQIKLKSDPTPWRIPTDLETEKLREDNTRVILVRDVETGLVAEYQSIVICSKAIGISKDAIAWRVKQPNQPVWPDKRQYKYKCDNVPWIDHDLELSLLKRGTNHIVLVRSCVTGAITEYPRLSDCVKVIGLALSTLSMKLKEGKMEILPGLLQIKLKEDQRPWRIPSDKEIREVEFGSGRSILVRNVNNGEVKEYRNTHQYCSESGYPKSSIHFRLSKKDQKPNPDGYQFKYKDDPTPWLEVITKPISNP